MNGRQAGLAAFGALAVAIAIVFFGGVFDRKGPQTGADGSAGDSGSKPAVSAPASGGTETTAAKPAGTPPTSTATATGDRPKQAAEADGAAPAPSATPSFDILRVEPDGSTVIAGRAMPGSTVAIMNGNEVVATAKAGDTGDFAAVLDTPLSPGDHQLVLKATGADDKAVVSDEVATVSIPKDKAGQLLAMVTKPGEASRIITEPQPASTAAPATQAEPGEMASATPAAGEQPGQGQGQSQQQQQQAALAPETANAPGQGTASASGTTADGAATPMSGADLSKAPADIRIDAVEVENDKLFVAGAARPGATVRVYADDRPVGEATVNPAGRFVVDGTVPLAVGNHTVRADVIDKATGSVVVRATVPFDRPEGSQVAAVAPSAGGGAAADATSNAASGPADAVATKEPMPAGNPADGSGASAAADGSIASGTTVAGREPTPEAAPSADPAVQDATKSDRTAEAEPRTIVQPALASTDGSVIIRRGDTLWQISRRVYGKGVRYTTIYLANSSQISNPDLIMPGQIFDVPAKALDNAEQLHRDRMLHKGK